MLMNGGGAQAAMRRRHDRPRVHIGYAIDNKGALVKKDFPMTIGVLAGLSGKKGSPQKLKQRQFADVNKENLGDFFREQRVELDISVPDVISGESGKEMRVKIPFEDLEQLLEPARLAEKIPALGKLLETRKKLERALDRYEENEDVERLLVDAQNQPELLNRLLQCGEAKPQ
jgi:type VI secretion system ImpB/VipA family protein